MTASAPTVTGVARGFYRVHDAMRGVMVDAGVSEIVHRYDPPVLPESLLNWIGSFVSIAATWARTTAAVSTPAPAPPASA